MLRCILPLARARNLSLVACLLGHGVTQHVDLAGVQDAILILVDLVKPGWITGLRLRNPTITILVYRLDHRFVLPSPLALERLASGGHSRTGTARCGHLVGSDGTVTVLVELFG